MRREPGILRSLRLPGAVPAPGNGTRGNRTAPLAHQPAALPNRARDAVAWPLQERRRVRHEQQLGGRRVKTWECRGRATWRLPQPEEAD